MLQLLSNCPAETAHLRKELLIAAKHILTTELRNRTSVLPLATRLSVNVGLLAVHCVLSLQLAQYFGSVCPFFIAILDVFFLLYVPLYLPLSLPAHPSFLLSLSLCLSPHLFCLPPGFSLCLLNSFIINVIISLAQFMVWVSLSTSLPSDCLSFDIANSHLLSDSQPAIFKR